MKPLGLDIFWRDRLIDWLLARTRFSFVLIKASEYQEDPLFRQQWAAAKGHVYRGAYHFFRPLVDRHSAAKLFCDILASVDEGELEPVLDLEVFDGVTDLLERAKVFVDDVFARTGKKCIIYTNKGVLVSAGAGRKTLWGSWKYGWLREHRLWLAAPTFESNTFVYAARVFNGEATFTWPSPPEPFDKIHFLQWTWYGVPELTPGYNLEPYHKSQVDWDYAADGELPNSLPPVEPPVEPPTGGDMNYSLTTIPAVGTVIMRTDHSFASGEAGYFLDGQTAKGNVVWEGNGEKWMQTVSIDDIPKSVWIPVERGSMTYTDLKEEIVVPPPVVEGKLPVLYLHALGYPDITWTPL